MIYFANGTSGFENMMDMYYDLFSEIGLGINSQQYLYDQDTQIVLMFKDKYIKASVTGEPLYAGRNDIVFEPAKNYTLMTRLFEYYLDKCQNSDDGDMLQGYIAHYIDDDETKEKQRVVVKTVGRGEISSNYYFNIYLAYIDCLFRIAGYNVNLNNFDIRVE